MRRHTIASLMAATLVVAVGIAALRNASETWAGIVLFVTLLLLGMSPLAILHRREGKRAFWQGFALFGWGYVVLTMAPWFADRVGPKLPTSQLLGYAHARLNPPRFYPVFFTDFDWSVLPPSGAVPTLPGEPGSSAAFLDLGMPAQRLTSSGPLYKPLSVYVDLGTPVQQLTPAGTYYQPLGIPNPSPGNRES